MKYARSENEINGRSEYLTRRVQRILERAIARSEIVERAVPGTGTKTRRETHATPFANGALPVQSRRVARFFYFACFLPLFFRWSARDKNESGEGTKKRKSEKKKKERKGAATRERINNAAREERGGSAELYVSKAASRVMTRRPIHVRYLGHT